MCRQFGRLSLAIMITLLVLGTAGCTIGPRALPGAHWDYNQAVRKSNDEQLLLNIVRLRYDELPLFLQVSSISSSFSLQNSLGATGTVTETVDGANVPNVLGLNGSVSYSETPTITWSLPESQEFMGRLMAPMGADQLTVLAQSGWGEDRVFEFGIKKINRVRNRDFEVGQGVYEPATYAEFREVLSLISELRKEGVIDFAYGGYRTRLTMPFPLEQLDSRAVSQGLPNGIYYFPGMEEGTENLIDPVMLSLPLNMRLSKASDEDPRVQRLRQLLDLDPEKYSFSFINTTLSSAELINTALGRVSQAFDPTTRFTELVMYNRSMLEILYFASNSVDVPQSNVEGNSATASPGPVIGNLRIQSSEKSPANAWVKIPYQGHWYYIAQDDAKSRDDFLLVQAMYAASIGSVPGAKPVLTLPVK